MNKLSRKYYFVGFLLLCVLAQYIMIAQYKVTLPYDDPRFTIKALTGAPGFITHHYDQILRSTNLVRLLFLGHFNNWDFTDVLFLLISPFSQLISIVLVCLGFLYIPKITDRGFFFNTKIITGLILLLSIILTSIVWITAPPKTAEEISKRKEYSELIKKADVLEKAGQYDEAIEIFSNAFTLLPIAWKPLFRIAVLWNKKNNLPEANRYYAMVLNIIPNQPETLFSLGNNLMSLGKFKEAEHYLKTAIRQKPRNKNYYNVLAQVYAKTNRPAEAEDIFKEAINLDPAFSDSYINLAILYTITNRQGKALPYLKEGIRLGARGDSIIKLAEHYGLSLE